MTDSHPDLRNKFDFGAQPAWATGTERDPLGSSYRTRPFPGSYIPDDPPIPHNDDEVVHPVDSEAEPELVNPTQQSPDKTCRICLAGAEDGTTFRFIE
jgi:hypothetical protein